MAEPGEYQFRTSSGSVYGVRTPESGRDVATQLVVGERERKRIEAAGKDSKRVENEQATAVFITNEQMNLLMHAGLNLRSRGYRVQVRAVADTKDAAYYGREPQVNSVSDAMDQVGYLNRGGSYRLFLEKGRDYSKESLDLGPVDFFPLQGKRCLLITNDTSKNLVITSPIDNVALVGASLRLARAAGYTFFA